MREIIYNGIILKQQPFGEADEILTFYTREAGKLRALAKSVKLSKSKLRHCLQPWFVLDVRLSAASGLAKVLGARVRENFPKLLENVRAISLAFVATELTLKFSPDVHKNTAVFDLLLGFLRRLNRAELSVAQAQNFLAKFKLEFLTAQGVGVRRPLLSGAAAAQGFFSFQAGGFTLERAADAKAASPQTLEAFRLLDLSVWDEVESLTPLSGDLQALLSEFLEYHLQRRINSERFLESGRAVV